MTRILIFCESIHLYKIRSFFYSLSSNDPIQISPIKGLNVIKSYNTNDADTDPMPYTAAHNESW